MFHSCSRVSPASGTTSGIRKVSVTAVMQLSLSQVCLLWKPADNSISEFVSMEPTLRCFAFMQIMCTYVSSQRKLQNLLCRLHKKVGKKHISHWKNKEKYLLRFKLSIWQNFTGGKGKETVGSNNKKNVFKPIYKSKERFQRKMFNKQERNYITERE